MEIKTTHCGPSRRNVPRRRPVEPIVRLDLQEPTFKLVISDNVEGPDLADLNRLSPI